MMALKSMDGKELLFRMALFVVCALIFWSSLIRFISS